MKPEATRPRPVLALLLAGAAALALAGCLASRSVPNIVYYTLTPFGEPTTRLPGPVEVGTFTADEPYTSVRLAYRTSPYRIEYYNFHRWAGSPPSLVGDAIRDYLERAPAADGPPLKITGHLRRLEEYDEPEGWQGGVVLDIAVERAGRPWFAGSYEESEPAHARNPEDAVAAMSRALTRILDRLAADLARAAGR